MSDNLHKYCKHCGEDGIYELGSEDDDVLIVKLTTNSAGKYYYEFRHVDGDWNVHSFCFSKYEAKNIADKLLEVLKLTDDNEKEWIG